MSSFSNCKIRPFQRGTCRLAGSRLGRIVGINLLVFALAGSFALAENADPVSVYKHQEQERGMDGYRSGGGEGYFYPTYHMTQYVRVTAKTDEITINSIVLNKGNCSISVVGKLPATLKFGDYLEVVTGCNPIETVIESDKGKLSFSFEN